MIDRFNNSFYVVLLEVNMDENISIKNRNVFLVYLFGIITFGIYFVYWYFSTRREMNGLGAQIPTAWLLIVPIVNIYWGYKYCEGFSRTVKKDDKLILWFVLFLLVGIVMPGIVQSELNKKALGNRAEAPATGVAKPKVAPADDLPIKV